MTSEELLKLGKETDKMDFATNKNELLPCPFCGGKMIVSPFIHRILELPKPIKLFGRWSLVKQRYRELPINYTVDCDDFCEGWCNSKIFIVEETEEKAINKWNTHTKRTIKERF